MKMNEQIFDLTTAYWMWTAVVTGIGIYILFTFAQVGLQMDRRAVVLINEEKPMSTGTFVLVGKAVVVIGIFATISVVGFWILNWADNL
jgi:hypothetical protein